MGTNPSDSPECAKLLLEAGANPDSRDTGGKTPLITACQTGGNRSIRLLIEHGADINAKTYKTGINALHTCCYYGNEDTFDEFIKYKPDGS